MKRALLPVAVVMILVLSTSLVQAQRRARGARGTVNTPFGSFSAGEMRAAGGNPFVAEEIREQKQMNLIERQMYRQQQQYMQKMNKQQKARQNASGSGVGKSKKAAKPTAARPTNATSQDATSSSTKPERPATPHVPGAPVD